MKIVLHKNWNSKNICNQFSKACVSNANFNSI